MRPDTRSNTPPTQIAIVDDDMAVCDALKWLFASRGHKIATFDSADAFLAD